MNQKEIGTKTGISDKYLESTYAKKKAEITMNLLEYLQSYQSFCDFFGSRALNEFLGAYHDCRLERLSINL
jgi:hypothetical protein